MPIDWNYYKNEKEELPSAATFLTAIDQGEVFPGWVIARIRWIYLVEEETVDEAKHGMFGISRSAIITFGENRYFRISWEESSSGLYPNYYYDQIPQEMYRAKKVIEYNGWEVAEPKEY